MPQLKFKRGLAAIAAATVSTTSVHSLGITEYLIVFSEIFLGFNIHEIQFLPDSYRSFLFKDYAYLSTFVVSLFLIAIFLQYRVLRGWVDGAILSMFPEPPHFLNATLEKADLNESDPLKLDPFAPGEAFFGRKDDTAELENFIDNNAKTLWWSVYGAHGIGKTRLIIDWLKKVKKSQRNEWDYGFFNNGTKSAELIGWRPRKHTIVVFDNIFDWPETWNTIATIVRQTRRSKWKLRFVLIDTVAVIGPDRSIKAKIAKDIIGSRYDRESLSVKELDPADWLNLQGDETDIDPPDESVQFVGLGNPLFAKLGERPWATLQEIASNRIEFAQSQFGKADRKNLMALAALGGPVSKKIRQKIAPNSNDINALSRLFPYADKSMLESGIPEIRPGLLAGSVLFQALSENQDAELIRDAAFEHCETTSMERIAELWTTRPEMHVAVGLKINDISVSSEIAAHMDLSVQHVEENAQIIYKLDQYRTEKVEKLQTKTLESLLDEMTGNALIKESKTPNLDSAWVEEFHVTIEGMPFNFQMEKYGKQADENAGAIIHQ